MGGTPRPTKKPHDMEAGDDKKVGAYVHTVLKTDFKHLKGADQKKCQDEGLVRAVQKKMRWDLPPAKAWLFTVLRSHRERAEAPEQEKPKRRAPTRRRSPSPSPPPPAKLSKPAPPPAKPAPPANQDPNASALDVATPSASSELDQLRALLERAEMARTGEKVVQVGGGRQKAVEMRRVGEAEWRWFESRKDAAAAFPGVSTGDVLGLCTKTASPFLLAKGFEARDVDEGGSMSKREPYAAVLRAAELRFTQADVSSDAGALSVAKRAAWEVNGQPPPESWLDALKSLGKFNDSQFRKFAAATAEAEAARFYLMQAANMEKARAASFVSRRAASVANARAEIEAMKDMIARGYFDEDTGDLIVGLRADDGDVTISFLDPNAPMDDGPVMIEVRGQEVELKGGPPPLRLAVGSGNLILAKRDKPVATLRRPTSNVVTWLTADFARGDTNYTHGGVGGPWAATITAHQKPGAYVRGLPFNPYDSLRDVGFHAVRGTRTKATTYDGDSIDGAGTEEFELHLFGSATDLMPAFAAELDRFSEALKATSRDEPRLCEGVAASYRRDQKGTGKSPAFLFAQPNRARGFPPRVGRGLAFLRTNDYPIMYEVARRCNWHCVRFELVAYRELVPVRLRLHVDSMAELSISTGGATSAALATA